MKLKLMLVALATLISTSAYGGPWATGIQFGGGGTFGTVTYHSSDVSGDNDPDRFTHEYELIQQAEGANVGIGYGFCWCERFRFTPQFDAYFLGSTARHAIGDTDDIDDTVHHRAKSDVILDLSIKPGIMVADCLLIEMKAGVSWAHVDQTMLWVNDDSPFDVQFKGKRSQWPTGYALGAAARFGITQCLSGFLAFDWHGYWSGPSNKFVEGNNSFWRVKISHFHAKTFSFGVSWSW
jgi:opacity protein-like surface antigen